VIPDFDDNGYLPPGIHPATLAEIEARFGREPELRRVEMQSLHWLIDLARRAGVKRIVLNGSFVTDAYEPNDVDCVLLVDDDFPRPGDEEEAEAELAAGLPFLQIDVVTQTAFAYLVDHVFGTDRLDTPKGVVEVIGWN
jgi:hypothetical protein